MRTAAAIDLLRHPALTRLRVPAEAPAPQPAWSRRELAGRLCELTPGLASAQLTAAFALVRDAQAEGEPAAWVSATRDTFFPPDAAAGGVALSRLPVVRVRDAAVAGRAADLLLRSGAFGLVVMELGPRAALPPALQGRLVKLAAKHDAALLCLTDKPATAPSLGSLVSLRASATRRRLGDGPGGGEHCADHGDGQQDADQQDTHHRFLCEIEVIKDKRRGPGWSWREVCRGPDGLC